MHHPVAVPLTRLEQHIAAGDARPVQDDLHLAVGPLLTLIGAVVPEDHRAAAVLALRDLAFEAAVLQRVVLGVDGQVVRRRIQRKALRHGPRDEHAVALQPEVPVQCARVMLLDDEGVALALARGARPPGHRLRRAGGVALAAVGRQLALAHSTDRTHRTARGLQPR